MGREGDREGEGDTREEWERDWQMCVCGGGGVREGE